MFSFAIEDHCNSTMSQKKRASRALSTLSEHLSLTTMADGLSDLLVAGLRGVTLYRNKGDASFSDDTAASGLNNQGRWPVTAAWADVDNDRDPDLFIVNYLEWTAENERECLVSGKPDFCHPRFYPPTANALFRNNGDGTFTDSRYRKTQRQRNVSRGCRLDATDWRTAS